MKKKLLLLLLLAATASFASIQQLCELVHLEVGIIDPTAPPKPRPKSPIAIPAVSLDGRVLSFDASCIGSSFQLLNNGNLVYSGTITESTQQIILNPWLSGDCDLLLYPEDSSYYFYGIISF